MNDQELYAAVREALQNVKDAARGSIAPGLEIYQAKPLLTLLPVLTNLSQIVETGLRGMTSEEVQSASPLAAGLLGIVLSVRHPELVGAFLAASQQHPGYKALLGICEVIADVIGDGLLEEKGGEDGDAATPQQ